MSRRKITTLLLTAVLLSCSINVSAAPIDNVEIYEPAGESDEVIFVAGQHQSCLRRLMIWIPKRSREIRLSESA